MASRAPLSDSRHPGNGFRGPARQSSHRWIADAVRSIDRCIYSTPESSCAVCCIDGLQLNETSGIFLGNESVSQMN